MGSWWNSLDSVNKVKDVLELIVIFGGIITAFAATGIFVVGRRVTELQSTQEAEWQRRLDVAEERIADRHLTPEQRAALLAVLRANPTGAATVTCALGGSGDACGFGRELLGVLREAGWQTPEDVAEMLFLGNPRGVVIRVHDQANVPNHALVLQAALQQEVGLTALAQVHDGIPVGSLDLLIGFK